MVKIIDLIKDEKLKFTYIYAYFNKKKNAKEYQGIKKGWHNLTFDECLEEYTKEVKLMNQEPLFPIEKRGKEPIAWGELWRNQFMIRMPQNKYFVIDIDEEDIYTSFVKILKDNDIYNESSITKSFNGIKNYYKRHFWYIVDDNRYNNLKNGNIKLEGLDIFYTLGSQISEWDDAIIENPPLLNFNVFEEIIDKLHLNKEDIFKKETNKEITTTTNKEIITNNDEDDNISINSDDIHKSNIEEALNGLNDNRADDYKYWFTIACAFINDNLDLNLFHKFSKRSKKYNKCSVDDFLKHLKPTTGYTSNIIYFYLKEDNIELFKKLNSLRKDIYTVLEQLTDNDLAKIFFNLKPNDYIYSSVNNRWYDYNDNNILVSYKNAPTNIYCNISNTLSEYIEEQKNSLSLKNKNFKKYSMILKKAYTKVNKSAFPKAMLPYLQNLYRDDTIEDKLDKNINLIAFKNGVYDIELGGFRAIKRDDYITKGISYNYPTKSNTEMRKYILKILGDIFDNEDLEYYLTITGLSLFTNKFDSCYIHSGSSGRNGKSLLGDCLTQTFENYIYSVQPEFFNSNTKTGQANQELAELKNARIMLCSEPDTSTDSKIKNSLFKRITGGDIISARANFSNKQEQYKPNFTIHMYTNDLPEFGKMEKAIQRRLRIIKYNYQFVEQPKNKYHKLVDTSLKTKIKNQDFKNEFALLLFEYAKKNIHLNIIEMPKNIKEATKEYFDNNNILLEWLETYYKYDYNSKNPYKIKCSSMKNEYLEDMDIEHIDDKKFIEYLKFNDVEIKLIHKSNHVLHYVRKTDREINEYKKNMNNDIIEIIDNIKKIDLDNNDDMDLDTDSDEDF